MAESQRGLYSILKYAPVYRALMSAMGAQRLRAQFSKEHIMAKPGDRVLDIGCGPADILEHLPAVDFHGWDPNPLYIEQARARFPGRGQFHAGYFGPEQAKDLAPFDIVILSAVLHHMSEDEAIELYALLRRVLKPGGRVVSIDNVFIDRQNPIARLLISMDRGRHVRTAAGYERLAASSFTNVKGQVVEQAFPPYTYFYMTAR